MHPRLLSSPRAVLAAIALAGLVQLGSAQVATGANLTQPQEIAKQLAQTIRVPIHTAAPADGQAYGVWAAGPNYKVSFHDGFTFYPVLGAGYPENLPLRWRTEQVTVGGARVFAEGTQPVTAHTDWRYEYRYPGFVEAYDVRTDGVEQTFTLLQRPQKPGDLVVVGRIASQLTADEVPTAHAALTFDGPSGEPVIRYGEAFAVDARGVKTPMQTARDGDLVTLRVPAAWLERATFPVTIDPLLAPVVLAGTRSRPFLHVDMAAQEHGTSTMSRPWISIAYSIAVSAADSDAYLVRVSPFLNRSPTVLFSDVTAHWSVPAVAVSHAYMVDRYGAKFPFAVLVMQRIFMSPVYVPTSGIAWHVNRGVFSSQSTSLSSPQIARRRPDVGGSEASSLYSTSTRACIVWEQDTAVANANTPNTEIYAAALDIGIQSESLGSPFVVASAPAGNEWDREFPAISESAPWVLVYQERPSTGSTYQVHATMLEAGLQNRGRTSFNAASLPPHPKVDGGAKGQGQYSFLVAYRGDTKCMTQRIDWNYNTSSATLGAGRKLPFSGFAGGVAFDTDTRSHFCVTVSGTPETASSMTWSQNHFFRLGHTGGIVEQGLLGNGGTAATTPVTHFAKHPIFGGDSFFVLAYQRHLSRGYVNLYTLLGLRLVHDPDVGNFPYGTGCAGQLSATIPYAGTDNYTVTLSNAGQAGQTAWLYVSALPAAIYVSPSCYVNIDPAAVVAIHTRTLDPSGGASARFPLPDDPVFLGNYHMQWIWSDGNGTWYMTDGLRAQVRN